MPVAGSNADFWDSNFADAADCWWGIKMNLAKYITVPTEAILRAISSQVDRSLKTRAFAEKIDNSGQPDMDKLARSRISQRKVLMGC